MSTSSSLVYLLKHAHLHAEDLANQALSPLGIQVRQLGILLVVDGTEPLSQQELAQRMRIDRTTMVAMLDTLEREGLVARSPHPDDRRRNVVSLTSAGSQLLPRAVAAVEAAERELLAPLGATKERQVREWLSGLAAQRFE